MDPVIVRNVKIGEGIPKICVPIVGKTKDEIIYEAKALEDIPKDLVEWRADWFEEILVLEKVAEILRELRTILKEVPLLFTFRTAEEGGNQTISADKYLAVNKVAIESGNVDLVDVEIASAEETVREIIACAHRTNVKVVASNHDFEKTPEKEEIVLRLRKMQEAGSDILKIAVMPESEKDVLTLLAANEEMVSNYARQPVVTMAKSGLGVVSRLAGEVFGSTITFGSAKKVSAPGQIPAKELKKVLELLHNSL